MDDEPAKLKDYQDLELQLKKPRLPRLVAVDPFQQKVIESTLTI